jgi:DNA mismatch repair protein MutS
MPEPRSAGRRIIGGSLPLADAEEVNPTVRFLSIIFDRPPESIDGGEPAEPAFFHDLNLDQVVESVTSGRADYDLVPIFHTPLHDPETVRYRQDVLRDLETRAVSESVMAFARKMRTMRECMAIEEKLRYRYQKERWFVEAVEVYCDGVRSLAEELRTLEVSSGGLRAFREYLASYAASETFTSLAAGAQEVDDALAEVEYGVHIKAGRVTVTRYEGEGDCSAEVEETFAKFKQGAVKNYLVKLPDLVGMDHVEAQVLDRVARLFPEPFQKLDEYCVRHAGYLDLKIAQFDREVQFYLAYLQYIDRLRSAGLPFCYPHVSACSEEVEARGAFDLALANKLVPARTAVVCNDFHLSAPERILVITGPNQGGKTTFARMFGQLHYLASLGLPVPAREARLFLPDRMFTHFEREEDVSTLRGKLDDELVRVHGILQQATGSTVIIMNESFTSTTLGDALLLGTEVLKRIIELDSLCVCVTFVDELASLSQATVSMVATVVPQNPALRTYRIVRQPANGLAYAAAIAEKHGLTYGSLRRRVAS